VRWWAFTRRPSNAAPDLAAHRTASDADARSILWDAYHACGKTTLKHSRMLCMLLPSDDIFGRARNRLDNNIAAS